MEYRVAVSVGIQEEVKLAVQLAKDAFDLGQVPLVPDQVLDDVVSQGWNPELCASVEEVHGRVGESN